MSKRVIGYINWQRNRRFLLNDSVINSLVADMKASAPEHIAVTGDLVNLALDREIELARVWLVTGNYKSDQVHVPDLLDRLGQ